MDGLFPAPERQSDRYAARPTPRDWSLLEDLALLPVILSCDSERAYLEACRGLCVALGREPVYGDKAKPTTDQVVKDCVSIIERRTVTSTLTGRPGLVLVARGLADDLREHESLTWAERTRFLKPYVKKAAAGSTSLGPAELAVLLGRNVKGLPDLVYNCLRDLRNGTTDDTQDTSRGRPFAPARQVELTKAVTRFANSAAHPLLNLNWEVLVELCMNS